MENEMKLVSSLAVVRERIAAAEALAEKATPGPWVVRDHPDRSMLWVEAPEAKIGGGPYGTYATQILSDDDYDTKRHDALFVAGAREGWPKAVAIARRLQAENKELREKLERVRELFDVENDTLRDTMCHDEPYCFSEAKTKVLAAIADAEKESR